MSFTKASKGITSRYPLPKASKGITSRCPLPEASKGITSRCKGSHRDALYQRQVKGSRRDVKPPSKCYRSIIIKNLDFQHLSMSISADLSSSNPDLDLKILKIGNPGFEDFEDHLQNLQIPGFEDGFEDFEDHLQKI